jgi:hypothetical protein
MGTGAQGLPGQVTPGLQTATTNLTNNPYVGLAQTAANQAGMYGIGTLAPAMGAGATSLFGLGQTGAPYAQQILQTGFDPQRALYNQQFQQMQDQSNAINSMYGLGSSPAGAGLAEQNANNFNIAWQQSQLQRQQTAAQGYGNLVNSVGSAYSGGADLGTAALGTLTTAGATPYNTYQTGQQNNVSALNALTSGVTNAYGLDANTLNALAAYLKLGQSATAIGQTGAANTAANNAALGSALGQGLQGLSGIFGNSSTGASVAQPTVDTSGSSIVSGDYSALGNQGTSFNSYGYAAY